jgi:hypothetical protein
MACLDYQIQLAIHPKSWIRLSSVAETQSFLPFRCSGSSRLDKLQQRATETIAGHLYFNRSVVDNFFSHDFKTDQGVCSKRRSQGYIDRISSPCH